MKADIALTPSDKSLIRHKASLNPKYFKQVHISISAASKMLNHANYGLPNEIMGLLQGTVQQVNGNEGSFCIYDIIPLPVDNTQTRVTANSDASVLMAIYSEWLSKIKTHDIVGWYHSHPNYGCWLSGIDVDTQSLYQQSTDPFLAIVVDPINSSKLEKIDIGAFRTYPQGYNNEEPMVRKDVPRKKAVDYGHHRKKYYALNVNLFAHSQALTIMQQIQQKEWANKITHSTFFRKMKHLEEQIKDEKADMKDYLQKKEEKGVNAINLKENELNIMKKVKYYAKGRNIPLLDSTMKALLF